MRALAIAAAVGLAALGGGLWWTARAIRSLCDDAGAGHDEYPEVGPCSGP